MAYRLPDDLTPPAHDPLADEQDLLTVLEAAARLHDELVESRHRLEAAESGEVSVPEERTAALRSRIEVLEDGLQRYDQLRRERGDAQR